MNTGVCSLEKELTVPLGLGGGDKVRLQALSVPLTESRMPRKLLMEVNINALQGGIYRNLKHLCKIQNKIFSI